MWIQSSSISYMTYYTTKYYSLFLYLIVTMINGDDDKE